MVRGNLLFHGIALRQWMRGWREGKSWVNLTFVSTQLGNFPFFSTFLLPKPLAVLSVCFGEKSKISCRLPPPISQQLSLLGNSTSPLKRGILKSRKSFIALSNFGNKFFLFFVLLLLLLAVASSHHCETSLLPLVSLLYECPLSCRGSIWSENKRKTRNSWQKLSTQLLAVVSVFWSY